MKLDAMKMEEGCKKVIRILQVVNTDKAYDAALNNRCYPYDCPVASALDFSISSEMLEHIGLYRDYAFDHEYHEYLNCDKCLSMGRFEDTVLTYLGLSWEDIKEFTDWYDDGYRLAGKGQHELASMLDYGNK